MLKGFAITPPLLGRISIGKVIEKNGKRLPMKDDQFTITSQLQSKEGWLPHPYDADLRKSQGGKIRSIPIRLMFNEPDLNFRAEYSLFDRHSGRLVCVGNGETCRRRTQDGIVHLPCPAPEGCNLANGGACKPFGRLNVVIGDDDPIGSFIFRTTGFNSIRTLAARLQYFKAISGDRLSCMPLELRLRGKSTRQSYGTAIYYVDITLRNQQSIEDALLEAKRIEEDGLATVEEFFPVDAESIDADKTKHVSSSLSDNKILPAEQTSLSEKLKTKAQSIDQPICTESQ